LKTFTFLGPISVKSNNVFASRPQLKAFVLIWVSPFRAVQTAAAEFRVAMLSGGIEEVSSGAREGAEATLRAGSSPWIPLQGLW
jgi:hypothetical protein